MKLTEKKIKEINEKVTNGLVVESSLGKVSVFDRNWGICDLEELNEMITKLMQVKIAVEDVTGIIL